MLLQMHALAELRFLGADKKTKKHSNLMGGLREKKKRGPPRFGGRVALRFLQGALLCFPVKKYSAVDEGVYFFYGQVFRSSSMPFPINVFGCVALRS
jgi:hypothetical protein